MSQLVKAIVASDTGNRKVLSNSFSPLFQDVFRSKSEIHEMHNPSAGVAKVYRIGVTIGSQVIVDESEQLSNIDALGEAIKRTKLQVIEAIFGEFRHDFMMLERALCDRDFQKARDNLRLLEEKMFGVNDEG
jgi:hypothetical protein